MRYTFELPMNATRTWMAAATCICVLSIAGCGSSGPPVLDDDPEAVIALKEAGATVERIPMMGAKDGIGRNIDMTDTTLEPGLFEHLKAVPNVSELTLDDARVTDDTLALISEMQTVSTLNLTGATVTDAGLKHLASLRSLFNLNLSDTQVTGAGLAELRPLGTLQLANLSVSDEDLAGLKHMKKLKFLLISGTQVTPAGATKFKGDRRGLIVVGVKQN